MFARTAFFFSCLKVRKQTKTLFRIKSSETNFVANKLKHVFAKIERQKCSLVTKRRKQRNLAEDKQKRYF